MSQEVKRYDIGYSEWGTYIGLKENGKYVTYEDHIAAMAELEAEKEQIIKIGVEGQREINRKQYKEYLELKARLDKAKDAIETCLVVLAENCPATTLQK